jgi:hypothetical protein
VADRGKKRNGKDATDLDNTNERRSKKRKDVTKNTPQTCQELENALVLMIEQGIDALQRQTGTGDDELGMLFDAADDNPYAQVSRRLYAFSKQCRRNPWLIWFLSGLAARCAFEDRRGKSRTQSWRYGKMGKFVGHVVGEFDKRWHMPDASLMLLHVLGGMQSIETARRALTAA